MWLVSICVFSGDNRSQIAAGGVGSGAAVDVAMWMTAVMSSIPHYTTRTHLTHTKTLLNSAGSQPVSKSLCVV